MHKLEHFQNLIKKHNLGGILISSAIHISYLTGYSNFSKDEREAYLVLLNNHRYIITDGRYTTAIRNLVKDYELIEITSNAGTKDILKNLSQKHSIKAIGIDENSLTVKEYQSLKEIFPEIVSLHFGEHRSIKTPEEIEKIKKSCEIGDQAFSFILDQIKGGMSEMEIGLLLEEYIRYQGAQPSFETIVAFGKNAAVPHHQTGHSKLEKNEWVLLDFGVKFENYCSDMTRTIFFGKPTAKQIKMYETVQKSQQEAVIYINNVVKQAKTIEGKEVFAAANKVLVKNGFPNLPHGLGHGIGLEVHEHPRMSAKSEDILKPGMVFSIEPGIYLPDEGGVRIEDLFVLKEDGLEQLTKSVKKFPVI